MTRKEEIHKTKPNEKKPVLREGVACRENCQRYPCFKGIESIISNLAMTCHEFKGEERRKGRRKAR